jgi:hypothetical protein
VDFCEELGFKRAAGLVGMTLKAEDWAAIAKRGGNQPPADGALHGAP